MTRKKNSLSRLAPYAITLAALLAADALAQAPKAAVTVAATATEDMRLWSFGDCDRRFPYVDTDTHKECVRVVGSPEARDARALHVCEVSNGADREETERCKSAYLANKEKAAQEVLAARSPAVVLPPPSAEIMRRVKAITTAAIEEKRAAGQAEPSPAAAEPADPPAELQAESSSSVSTTAVVLLVAALGGLGATVVRRKQAQSSMAGAGAGAGAVPNRRDTMAREGDAYIAD